MTAIAGLRFLALFCERPLTGEDRSLDRKSATDAFGLQCKAMHYDPYANVNYE